MMLYDCSCVLNSKLSVIWQFLLVISTNLVLRARLMNWKGLAKCDFSSSLCGPRLSGIPVGSAGPPGVNTKRGSAYGSVLQHLSSLT